MNVKKASEARYLRATISVAAAGGFSLVGGKPNPVLLKDMELPAEATYGFLNSTSKQLHAGHLPIKIEVFFGENTSGTDNVSLGEFQLTDIPPAPAGPKQIEMKLAVSANQTLSLALMDWVTLKYRGIGFIDISDIGPPEIVPEPKTTMADLNKTVYGQLYNLIADPQPREKGLSRRGKDISHKLTISFAEALRGAQKDVEVVTTETCPVCSGSGARPGTSLVHCPVCQGTGWKKEKKQTDQGPLWHVITCPACEGDGLIIPDPCISCQGKTWVKITRPVTVQIPAGIESGAEVRLFHLGEPGRYGGPPGHLRIVVTVADHPVFARIGSDISIYLPVSASFAKEGGLLQVPGVEKGSFHLLNLPPDTKGGMTFRVYEGEDYTLTALIETYRPSFLFALPNIKNRLQAIEEALGYRDFEMQASLSKVGADQTAVADELVQRGKTRGKLAQAVAGSTQGVGSSRNYAEFYTRRGDIYAQRGNQARALADYSKALELDPDYAPAYNGRSLIYVYQDDPRKALADLDKALELDPSNVEYYYHRGMVYHFQEDPTVALADYNKALELDPNNAEVYLIRGRLYQLQEDLAMALSDYDKAVELDPDNAEVYYRRGLLYQYQNDLAMALSDYDKAVELDPKNYEALCERGRVYMLQNDLENALADMNRVVERNPRNARAYNNRGYVCLLQNDFDNALVDYNKALELDPELVPAYNYRGKVYLKQGRYKGAVEDFRKSLMLHPGDMYVYQWLAQAYQGLGEKNKAIVSYQEVLEKSQDPELRQETREFLDSLSGK